MRCRVVYCGRTWRFQEATTLDMYNRIYHCCVREADQGYENMKMLYTRKLIKSIYVACHKLLQPNVFKVQLCEPKTTFIVYTVGPTEGHSYVKSCASCNAHSGNKFKHPFSATERGIDLSP